MPASSGLRTSVIISITDRALLRAWTLGAQVTRCGAWLERFAKQISSACVDYRAYGNRLGTRRMCSVHNPGAVGRRSPAMPLASFLARAESGGEATRSNLPKHLAREAWVPGLRRIPMGVIAQAIRWLAPLHGPRNRARCATLMTHGHRKTRASNPCMGRREGGSGR